MESVPCLRWDPRNVAHIRRHEVTPEEVEVVYAGDPVIGEGYAGRVRLVGPTMAGRMLSVILAPELGNVYYPVTARPASRKERRRYLQAKGGKGR